MAKDEFFKSNMDALSLLPILDTAQNVNVARFARNVERDFFCFFKHRAIVSKKIQIQFLSLL